MKVGGKLYLTGIVGATTWVNGPCKVTHLPQSDTFAQDSVYLSTFMQPIMGPEWRKTVISGLRINALTALLPGTVGFIGPAITEAPLQRKAQS